MNQNLTWIKLYRKLLDWEWFGHLNTQGIFIYLLLSVNTEDKTWHGIEIKRGQILTSQRKLSKILNLKRQPTRDALYNLQSTHDITIKATRNFSIITVNKFNEYQANNQQKTHNSTNKEPTKEPLLKNKEYKNKEYNTLESLGESDFKEIAETYKVSLSFVQKIYEELRLYCGSTGKKYANYKMTLMAWVRRKLEDKPTRLKDLEPNQILDIRENPERLLFYQRRNYDVSRMRAR